ncbi:MAG TPA: hypothetical protein VFN61_07020 [Acidimicrobiales bacterium]|nr:hypothetical protein [Acidimicrobiales bacterium]
MNGPKPKYTRIASLAIAAAGSAGAIALVLGASPAVAAGAGAAATTTTLAPPAQGNGAHKVFMYVDTVTGGGSPKPSAGCAQTNLFQRGQVVVFRMYGINAAAGGENLTSANVAFAYVQIPGVASSKLQFGNHGKSSYWTAAWTVPANYPLGEVDFSVHLTTDRVPATATSKAVPRIGSVFTQAGLAPPSRLTIVAS